MIGVGRPGALNHASVLNPMVASIRVEPPLARQNLLLVCVASPRALVHWSARAAKVPK